MSEYISKRRSPRRVFNGKVGLLYKGSFETTQALEIGEGGILVYCVNEMKKNESTVVTFSLRGAGFVSVRAEVRYQLSVANGKTAYGLQFSKLDISDLRGIRRYVSLKSKDEAHLDKEKVSKTYSFAEIQNGKLKPTAL